MLGVFQKKSYIDPIFAQLVQKLGTMKLLHWHYDKNIVCLKYNNSLIKKVVSAISANFQLFVGKTETHSIILQ